MHVLFEPYSCCGKPPAEFGTGKSAMMSHSEEFVASEDLVNEFISWKNLAKVSRVDDTKLLSRLFLVAHGFLVSC